MSPEEILEEGIRMYEEGEKDAQSVILWMSDNISFLPEIDSEEDIYNKLLELEDE